MKKSLLAVILAVAMVVPAFAEKGENSVNVKVGLGVNSNVAISGGEMGDDLFEGFKTDMPFMAGIEFFHGIMDNLSIGAGVNYVFDTATKSEINDEGFKPKGGTTNIYIAAKPEAKIDSDIFTSLYLIGQIGLSLGRISETGAPSVDSGLYLGAGLGTIIKDCIIVELIVSSCNGSVKMGHDGSMDIQYSLTTVNVGYKFAL